MRSYGLLIGGEQREGQGWNYTVRASALIADPASAFTLKRELELGTRAHEDAPPEVVGRCAWGEDRENAEALEAAGRARREYGSTSLSTRRSIMHEFAVAMRERGHELVEILVAEGHPQRLAEWEVRGIVDCT